MMAALDYTWEVLSIPVSRSALFLFKTIAILDIPYHAFGIADRIDIAVGLVFASAALANIFAAWLLSRWVFGVGPLRSLGGSLSNLKRRTRA
jgi:hypothetical protein